MNVPTDVVLWLVKVKVYNCHISSYTPSLIHHNYSCASQFFDTWNQQVVRNNFHMKFTSTASWILPELATILSISRALLMNFTRGATCIDIKFTWKPPEIGFVSHNESFSDCHGRAVRRNDNFDANLLIIHRRNPRLRSLGKNWTFLWTAL